MKLIDDIFKMCNMSEFSPEFSFSCVAGRGLVFEGRYRIEKFEETEIVINLFHGRKIKILGFDLKIGTLSKEELGISGKFSSIEILE